MEDKVIEHFCHKHPLFLKENHLETLPCYGCDSLVDNLEAAYVCMQEYCSNFILHKRCGELPSEIQLPRHLQHPLHLELYYNSTSGYICNLCSRENNSSFRYRCKSCDFDIDITCTRISIDLLLKEKKELQHPSHPHHHLTLMRKHAFPFCCDGCGVEDVDMAYICSSCEFWIHKTCASLPPLLPTNRHHHQLSLAFSFPLKHRYAEFIYKCDVCNKDFDTTCWVYFCGDCRFFAHIKCVTFTTTQTLKQDSNSDEDDNGGSNVIQFPLHAHDIMKELITPFVIRERGVVKDMPTTVTMPQTEASFSMLFNYHYHPLSLVLDEENHKIPPKYEEEEDEDEGETSELDDELMRICNACVTPIISPPYYQCIGCNYFVHSVCYFLPKTLPSASSSLHSPLYGGCSMTHSSIHKYTLYTGSKSTRMYKCYLCKFFTNGVGYECKGCKTKIDVKCASLPSSIKHAAHPQHKPLVMTRLSAGRCHVCDDNFNVGYRCGSEDCDFALDFKCAMLPWSIRKHEWDKHPLLLSYDASLDHPSDFMCEFCENELHPKKWMYHCRQCDSSFHLFCPKIGSGGYRNIKFGQRLVLDGIHAHALTFNWITLQKRCSICRRHVYDYFAFECASCYYVLCTRCTGKEIRRFTMT